MDLTLIRFKKDGFGIFSRLYDDAHRQVAVCLEHAYPGPNLGEFFAKIPDGIYRCVRGMHMLKSGPIETFEVTGIEGHAGILFHPGNFNDDSEGCILMGKSFMTTNKVEMITQSRLAFESFMRLQSEVDEFTLIVK